MANYGSLPTRGDIADEVLEGLDPRLQVGMEAIAVAKTPYTLQFNDLINSANGPWASFTNAAIFGDDVDGAFSRRRSEMQSIIDMRHSKRLRGREGHAPPGQPSTRRAVAMTTFRHPDDHVAPATATVLGLARAPLHRTGHGAGHGLLRAAAGPHRLDEPAQLAADGRAALDRLRATTSACSSDTRFLSALSFTAYYTVIVTIAIFAVAFPLAIFVEKQRPLVSPTARSSSCRWSSASPPPRCCGSGSPMSTAVSFGALMVALGLVDRPLNLLAKFDTAFLSIIVMVVWKIAGFTMIILLTGLQAIPPELTEAARIDGAGRWQRFRYLTLPLMRRTIALALILSVTGSILAFDQFYIMTSGGPQNRMISVVYYIFNQSFVSFNLGYGAALSIALLASCSRSASSSSGCCAIGGRASMTTSTSQSPARARKAFGTGSPITCTGVAVGAASSSRRSPSCSSPRSGRGTEAQHAAAAALADHRLQPRRLPSARHASAPASGSTCSTRRCRLGRHGWC